MADDLSILKSMKSNLNSPKPDYDKYFPLLKILNISIQLFTIFYLTYNSSGILSHKGLGLFGLSFKILPTTDSLFSVLGNFI